MKLEKIKFRDLGIACYNNSNNGKPSIVFVHGNSMSSRIWEKQFFSELSKKYHLVAFDMPGCGESDHSIEPDNNYNFSDLGDALDSVCNYFRLNNYVIVGYSLGGNVVMQNLSKLKGCIGIFINSVPVTLPLMLDRMYQPDQDLAIMFQKDYTSEALDRILKRHFCNADLMPPFLKTGFEKTDGNLRQTIMNNIIQGKLNDEVKTINLLSIPIALVVGKEENIIDVNYFKTFTLNNIWRGEVQFISDANHCPQIEEPEQYNSLLDSFVMDCNRLI